MSRELVPCGTVGAWSRHKRRGEPVCDPCLAARRDYLRDWREAHPDSPRRPTWPKGTR